MKVRPPFVALGCVMAAWTVDWVLPELRLISGPYRFIGVIVITGGLGLGVLALRVFRSKGTTEDPFGEPTALALTGPFRLSRNPMYLGVAMLLFGLAIYAGTLSFLVAPAAFVLIINFTQIPREEKLLERIFGDQYIAYKSAVRRWL